MRRLGLILGLIAGLLPVCASAQNTPNLLNLPANTVIGRLGISAGPWQAIPFTRLGLVRTASPVIGLTGSQNGSIGLQGLTSGTVTLTVQPIAGTWTLKLPTTAGSAGQVLGTDGTGTTSWVAGSGTINSGTSGQLAYYTGSTAINGNANLNISSSTLTVGVAGSALGSIALAGNTSGTTTLRPAAAASGTLTLPAATDTLVGQNTTDTLTNKTLTSPTLVTPTLGVATATTINKVTITAPASGSTLTIADGKVFTLSNTLTFTGTDASTVAFGAGGTVAYATNTLAVFAATTSAQLAGVISDETGTGALVFANTPTLVTPVLGVATATTINKLSITAPASGSTLTIADGKTLVVSNTLTFIGTDGNSFTFPSGSDTVVTLAATQTLSNKTLTSPVLNGGSLSALTALAIRSTGSGAFDLTFANTENLTAGRTLTLTLNNANRTINLSGNLTLSAGFTTAGSAAITLTATGATNVTLPTSGTLAAIDIAQTFSSANIFSALQQFTDIKLSSGKIYPTGDSTTALQLCKADGTTCVVRVDTTNARVGINKTPGAFDVDINGAANVGGALTFGTATITGLTAKASPDASNDYVIIYDNAGVAIKKATVGSVAAAATAGVSSLNGLTGGLSVVAGNGISVSAAGASITVANTGYEPVNAQTGTSYAILDADRGKVITTTNAAAQAYSIAQAGAAGNFAAGWFTDVVNTSTVAAGIVTITPATSTINGAATYKLLPNWGARIVSDGTNYQVIPYHQGREVLTAARTYYVRTDGNDNCVGTTDGAGSSGACAFLTIQKAINVVAALDTATFAVTVQVRTGTYTGAVALPCVLGSGVMTLTGDTTTPSNVIISTTSNNAIAVSSPCANWTISGLKLQTTTSGFGLIVNNNAVVSINGKMDFGTVAAGYYHIDVESGGSLSISSNYNITGGGASHFFVYNGGHITLNDSIVATASGTFAFSSAFANAGLLGGLKAASYSVSGGTITGTRWLSDRNAIIYVNGTCNSVFPGNANGSATNGGLCS